MLPPSLRLSSSVGTTVAPVLTLNPTTLQHLWTAAKLWKNTKGVSYSSYRSCFSPLRATIRVTLYLSVTIEIDILLKTSLGHKFFISSSKFFCPMFLISYSLKIESGDSSPNCRTRYKQVVGE